MDPANRQLMQVARSVLAELDVDEVLERVLESARELTGARYAALGVLAPDRNGLERFLSLGIDDELARHIGPTPRGLGVLGELISNPMPLRLRDVGDHPHSYGFPPGHPPMRSFLGVPVLVAGEPFGNLYLTEKAGAREFSAGDEEAALVLADLAGVAIDHARRYTLAEAQRGELEQTVSALEATTEISRALAGETDIDVILRLVAKRGRALVSAKMLVIEVQAGPDLVVATGAGDLPPKLVGSRIPIENTVASIALVSGRTQRLSDELNRARFVQHGIGQLNLRAEDGLVVPMIFHGDSFGVLLALDRLEAGPAFSAADQVLLESFAASAAMAVATAQSAARERRRQVMAAAEAERGRWARELHDDTLQAMGSIKLLLSAARRAAEPEAISEGIGNAIEQLQVDMDNLRRLVSDLRPGALDQLGVDAAVVDLVDRVSARSGIEIDLDARLDHEQGRAPDRLDPELETAIYRTVQEALNNILKHSGATKAIVELRENGGQVFVRVRDNGRGFDPSGPTEGFGLVGMRERVALIAGSLRIESHPDTGTTIEAVLPAHHRSRPVIRGGATDSPLRRLADS